MMPFDPYALSVIWFKVWRGHVRSAKENAGSSAYCNAAVIAQAMHVMEQALEVVKHGR